MTIIKRLGFSLSIASLVVAATFVPAHAGEAVSPGTVQDTIRQQPPALPLPEEVPVPEGAEGSVPQPPAGPKVRVESFEFSGNTVYSDAELAALLENYSGSELTLNQIYAAADGITKLYRDAGYGLANAVVPAQRLSDGSVRIEIIEGRIGGVSVSGNEDYSFAFLQKRFAALEPGQLYTNRSMERSVLLINDLPGIEARAVIKPGSEYGTSDITFKVEEDDYEGSVGIDNYGREELGQIRFVANAYVNNIGGIGDRLNGSLIYSEDGLLTYGNIAYGLPLSDNGSRLRFTFNKADYEVEGDVFADLGISGDNTTYRVDYLYPLDRTRTRNVVFNAAYQRFETDSFIEGIVLPNNSTELDLLELSVFMSGMTRGQTGWTFSAIVSGNGKSNESTATEPQSDAQQAKLRLDGSVSVYSGDPLVDSQKFSLGGPYSVRGYFPAEARGDEGAYVGVEVRKYFRISGYPLAGTFYVDGGFAKRELLPGEDPTTDVESELASAGVGLLLAPDRQGFSGSLLYAKPIDNHVSINEDDDGHFWANVMWNF